MGKLIPIGYKIKLSDTTKDTTIGCAVKIYEYFIKQAKVIKTTKDGTVDSTSSILLKYLQDKYPNDEWDKNPKGSQHPFDLVSFLVLLSVEIKTVKVSKKSFQSNASVYPDKIKVKDLLKDGKITKSLQADAFENNRPYPDGEEYMDCMVVIVLKDENDYLIDCKIVDGTFWGITYQYYLDNINIFNVMNSDKIIYEILSASETGYADALSEGRLDGVHFNIRKLIELDIPPDSYFE